MTGSVLLPGCRERAWSPGEDYGELPSGLLVPSRIVRARPIAIDLFCGAGGFSCGLHQAGYQVIAAADSWAIAALTYLHNLGNYPVDVRFVEESDRAAIEKAVRKAYGMRKGDEYPAEIPFVAGSGWISSERGHEVGSCAHHIEGEDEKRAFCEAYHGEPAHRDGCELFWLGDVSKLTAADFLEPLGLEIGDVDLICGGPPCQGFSHVGKRQVMDPRNSLVFEFVRLVLEIRPKAMIMENVVGIASMITPEGIPVVDAIAYALDAGEFGAYDALRKSLLVSAGAGGVLKKESRGERERARRLAADVHDDDAEVAAPEDEQLSLMGAAA